ncbi:MAG: ATP-binding cassette domain-containing protein [Firmicutes bacterium]|nr:ATP-binding cassette domain-containing protein [Bacillota bacterium]
MGREPQDDVIVVDDLVREFGDFTAVDHMSFRVHEGEVFGLLGPNGAGKSTTIRMLCTLLRPTGGHARIAGYDVVRQASQVRQHIGLVAEKLILYDRLTARENLRLFGKLNHLPEQVIDERADYWLDRLQMTRWQDHLAGTFSTGMKQRINIARALLNMPRVLFLDEPTLGLDPQTTRSIREFIMELHKQGMTIILTTHMMAEAEMLCDRVGIVDHGKMVALDTPGGLKRLVSDNGRLVLELEISNLSESMVRDLQALPEVASIDHESATSLRLHAQPGEGGSTEVLSRVIAAIHADGGRILRLSTVEPTLEDVFLKLTGRAMRDEASEKVAPRRGHWRRAATRVR